MSAIARLREEFEKSARRFHGLQLYLCSPEHRWWKFEHCPADSCRLAREAMAAFDQKQPPVTTKGGEEHAPACGKGA